MAVIAAVLLVAILGMGAYVIDVGALFEERRDLQNGADAAALAVAADCAQDGICSPAGAQPEAERIAAFNSNDGQATVNVADIRFDPASPPKWVTVTVHTKDASDGDGEINYVLAPVLGNDGKAVSAEATAGWRAAGGGPQLPITISSCEWNDATVGGTVFPAYAKLWLHGAASSPPACSFGPGQDIDDPPDGRAEGGFGFLHATDCVAELVGDDLDFMVGEPGAPNPEHGGIECRLGDILGQDLLIPIFDDIAATGAPCDASPGQNCYHIYGFGAFHVDNVDFNGPWSNHGNICGGSERCFDGMFIEFVTLAAAPDWGSGGTPPNLGVSAVVLTG